MKDDFIMKIAFDIKDKHTIFKIHNNNKNLE